MHSLKYISSIIIAFSLLSCKAQEPSSEIVVQIPSIEQEATSIWRTINDIAFFEQQGYNIQLPNDPVIDSLIAKSKAKTFGNEDYPTIFNLLESKVYQESDYEKAFKKVKTQAPAIQKMLRQLSTEQHKWNWDFKMYPTYTVVFTLYGTGGSYDPDTGTITLFTNTEGGFMNYENPANTIIHEIVHIGVEESIVQTYQLSHGLKERLIDNVVTALFKDQLPNYRIQNMGDRKMDGLINAQEDLHNLDQTISEFLKKS
ncbi:hypothetical protein POV27_05825 [Aureisphaera galaxeae]|uniref:hypothetical protein n=1 Tax=Aureisphaera galaxeae TaxID=1538023 RepID=UPI0023500C04|nr:hypothetical protein [Aureisphaera galaxeae]MDC8003560.1 hypothetical protein [Aureisphaera galaxeae]